MASGSKSLTSNDDLPAYTVRVSDRAKSVRISLSVEAGLEVVIPADYDHQKVPELIQKSVIGLFAINSNLSSVKLFFSHRLPMSCLTVLTCDRWAKNGRLSINRFRQNQGRSPSKKRNLN